MQGGIAAGYPPFAGGSGFASPRPRAAEAV